MKSVLDKERAIPILKDIFSRTNHDDGHGLEHALIVHNHSIQACFHTTLSRHQRHMVEVASLIHDIGDHKFIKRDKIGVYEREFLDRYFGPGDDDTKHQILFMIDAVSCSKWGDQLLEYKGEQLPWMHIPRYCDRLEAMGEVGLERAIIYSKLKGRPLYSERTKRCYNLDELERVAPKSRYVKYVESGGKPVEDNTTIDHLYDKVIHLNVPSWMDNEYIISECKSRISYIKGWIIGAWTSLKENGTVSFECK